MQIRGIVESVIFRNADNGYTVLSINNNGILETAVGVFPPISEGEDLIIEGERVINEKFGEQIKVLSVKTSPPNTPEGIIKYLSSDLFKGVGEVTARRIVKKFGDKTFKIIEENPILLDKIQGITASKAIEIGEKYNELRIMQDSIIFLQNYDISLNLAIKIYKRYKLKTQAQLCSNPYQMVYDIDGIGYFTADRIALKMGLDRQSPLRLQAAINYVLLNEANKSGNTYLPIHYLVNEVIKLLNFDDSIAKTIEEQIDLLTDINVLVKFNKNDKLAVMLKNFFNLEKSIATRLNSINNDYKDEFVNIDREIEAFEIFNNIKLHSSQIAAVVSALNSGGIVITGGPGTGKTTIIKCIISIFKDRGMKVALCAPTGRAAKRLTEATGEVAMTIHRLLELDFGKIKANNYQDDDYELDAKVIIVDEVSMADEYVFNALLRAVNNGRRIIIVGDKDQLPSVGAGNVLSDIIQSKIFPVKELTEIYRQEAESYIISNAHRINKGIMPILNANDKDFFYIETSNIEDINHQVTTLCSSRLPKYLNVSSYDIQVLCPMKKGVAGVNNINSSLQNQLNPTKLIEIESGDHKFRVGDKVIQLSNNYQSVWTMPNGESGEGIFNGDIGIIKYIDKNKLQITVTFEDDKKVVYNTGDFDQLALAYAITIHKSQGSEFEAVVIALTPGSNTILTRNLLYTAITRAKRMVVLVGDKKTISYMVSNNHTTLRYTCLVDFIKQIGLNDEQTI